MNAVLILAQGIGAWAFVALIVWLGSAWIASSISVRKGYSEKRATSVNLYFMGRTLALCGDRTSGEAFLDLADRYHAGKRKVSRKDPAFR